MNNPYSSLLAPLGQVLDESKSSFQFLTERHVQALWFEQSHFKSLKTPSGEPIKVISPGIWNQNAGPDFLKAHIAIGNKEMVGDVEIHLSSQDWYHHGHQQDVRYNRVVLHVCLWNQKTPKPIVSENGRVIPEVFLEAFLTCPPPKLIHLIDLDLYPYQTFVGSGKCARLLFQDLSDSKILQLFQNAAAWRLLQKSRSLHYRIEDSTVRLLGGMALALGYKHNAETFLQIFLWLHPLRHLGEEAVLALALGACGVFDESNRGKWGHSDYYQHLKALYMMLGLTHTIPAHFVLAVHQVRPLNHPVRRLACLAKLVGDTQLLGLYSKMKKLWNDRNGGWVKLRTDLLKCFPTYQDFYWNTHYLFEQKAGAQSLPLIGIPSKQEMLVNAFFPLLYQEIAERGDAAEVVDFKEFYNTITASRNSKSKYLVHRFFGQSYKQTFLNRADTEQGAFQLHRDFCTYYEASCEGCPFIDNYKNLFNVI